MLCKFTGGGPENNTRQEIADDVQEVRCTGLTPGFAEVYARDPKNPKRFKYAGRICTGPYVPGFEPQAVPSWITEHKGPVYDLGTLEEIKPES